MLGVQVPFEFSTACLMATKLKSKGHRITVGLTEEEYSVLERIAALHDTSLSWVVRRSVSEYLDRHGGGLQTELPLNPNE